MATRLNRGLLIFLLFFLLFSMSIYYIDSILLALLISVTATTLIYLLISKLLKVHSEKNNLSKKQLEDINKLNNLLILSSSPTEIVKQVIPTTYIICSVKSDQIWLKSLCGYTLVCCVYKVKAIEIDTLMRFVKSAKNQAAKLIVCVNKLDGAAAMYINDNLPNTKVLDIKTLYDMLKKANKLPDLPTAKKTKKFNIILYNALNKSKCNGYIVGGIFVVLTGIISYFPIYSYIVATIMFALAIYSAVNKRFNIATPTVFDDK